MTIAGVNVVPAGMLGVGHDNADFIRWCIRAHQEQHGNRRRRSQHDSKKQEDSAVRFIRLDGHLFSSVVSVGVGHAVAATLIRRSVADVDDGRTRVWIESALPFIAFR